MSMDFLRDRRVKRARRGVQWLAGLTSELNGEFVRLRRSSLLMPVGDSDGALLAWSFDQKPGVTQILFVRLTESEAVKVYETDPYEGGMLESVRASLHERWAVLAIKCGNEVHATYFEITGKGTEQEFVSGLDAAAASCPVFSLVDRKQDIPEVQVFARTAMSSAYAFA